MNSPVEQIKQRLSIVDVIGSYVKLQKAGKNFKAKSPFTSEKTPSFFVSPDRDMYYCFSSGKGGDIFTFVQEMEGLDFKGALRVLAEKAGVELTAYQGKNRDERDKLFELLEAATAYFEKELAKSSEAKAYLKERGFSEDTISKWRVGFAAPGWRNLSSAMKKDGWSIKELEEAGLIKEPEKGGEPYDRFRGRVMFPISDSAGRVIAFSSRILPSKNNPEYKDDVAKYINSPDTSLYNKSHVLYGYDRAKMVIRKSDFSIVVEGQMDLLLSHQAGYPNTVAVSGSAMTTIQLNLLKRLSHNVVLAFDADQAGVTSSGRTAARALAMGMNVKVATLPTGVDPADLVKRDPSEWKKVVRESKHIVEFYLDYLGSTIRDRRVLRLEVGKRVLPYVALIPNRIDQAHFVEMVAARLGIDEGPVWEELSKTSVEADEETPREEVSAPKEKEQKVQAFKSLTERRLVGILISEQVRKGRDIDVETLEKKLTELLGEEGMKRALEAAEGCKEQLLFEVESVYENAHALALDMEEMLRHMERGKIFEEREDVLVALREAESLKDEVKIGELTKKYAVLTKDLEALSVEA